MSNPIRPLASILAASLLAHTGAAQAGTVPGRDLMLIDTWNIQQFQRTGTFPAGNNALGAFSTVCNAGTSPIPFISAMNPNHAFIHYMVCRETPGRLVQISTWGYVKHTSGSGNVPSPCGACAGPGDPNQVEVGCSDTYGNFQAVDHYDLGPPDEIDPWLGLWVPQCSYFDRGEPEAPPGQLCDSARSLSHAQANVLNQTIVHQMSVLDADLAVPGANYWFQCGYLCPGEAEANRTDNLGSRGFTPTWNGTSWTIQDGPDLLPGSVLQRWTGATITSNTNGADDGRFYVAVQVTGPSVGFYHYEYAIHDRDNRRGLGAFRVPVCPNARVQDFGFRDIDQDGNNNWVASRHGSEITFQTSTNPLRWNMIFNFWFDSDAAPDATNTLSLDQFDLGAGALTVAVTGTAPTGLYNEILGPGCGVPTAPTLYAIGSPARASLGNATFALQSGGNPSGAVCGFVLSLADGSTSIGPGCTAYTASVSTLLGPLFLSAGPAGTVTMPLPVPNQAALEGTHLDFQMANIGPPGAFLGTFNLSNGLRVRIGNLLSGCP
jgi:hypothetical protein